MSKIVSVSKILPGRIKQKRLPFASIQSRFISAASVLVPTHQQIAHLILEQKSAKQALEIFSWASKIPSFTPTTSTYRALIHGLCVFREFDVVEQLLDEMPRRTSSFPEDDIFITIVRGFGRAKRTKDVIRVLDLVSKFGNGVPSLKLLNSILDVLVKDDIDIAREFYRKKMMGSGDEYTYGILMKGFCLTNRIGDGFKLLQVMKTHDVKINVVVYNTLIHALCKNGKVGRARSLMNEMEEFSDVTFNILISAYCNEKDIVQALVMVEKCFSYGFIPDVVALTKVVDVLCDARRNLEAVEILDRVEARGGNIDVVAYNTLIKGFLKAGKIRAGYGILKQMEMKGCLPNTNTYDILIAGLCGSGMLDSALDTFHEMEQVGVKWSPDTFETLIYGLCSSGRLHDGLKIFELMGESEGVYGRVGPYNSILYGLYKQNRLDEAMEFLNYMKNSFPRTVDRTRTIIRLCNEGRVEEAKRVLVKMKEEVGSPSVLVYENLVREYCKTGCTMEAVELMNEMIKFRYYPTSKTFNLVISGFCRQDRVRTALRFMEDLAMAGCEADSESHGLIINGFRCRGESGQALILFLQMVEKGIKPDYCCWNSMMNVMFEGKSMFKEHKLMHQLLET